MIRCVIVVFMGLVSIVPAEISFTDVTAGVGLSGVTSGKLAVADYNQDGYLDILVGGNRLFENSGPPDYTFIEITNDIGIGGAPVAGGVFGDYDNDGSVDLFCFAGLGSHEIIWHHRSDGTFEKVTDTVNVFKDTLDTEGAAWGCSTQDGFIDIAAPGFLHFTATGYKGPWPDRFYKNNRDGTFSDKTADAGVGDYPRLAGRAVAWCDFNNDGWQDFYISNYILQPNLLWQNDGDGTFTQVSKTVGVEGHNTSGYFGHTISSAWGDFNNDGYFDLFAANLAHKDPDRGPICDDSYIFKNNGPPDYTFTDIRTTSGIPIHPVGSSQSGYYYDELFDGVDWGDYDNDGFFDLAITQVYNIAFAYSFIYRNNGDETFSDATAEVGSPRVWDGWAPVWFDYNNDGNLDLLVYGSTDYPITAYSVSLFKNSGSGNNWIEIDLEGSDCNRSAIGAVVKVWSGSLGLMRQVEGGTGCGCQNPFRLHFGLGQNAAIDSIAVRWPCGTVDKISPVETNTIVKLVEGGGAIDDQPVPGGHSRPSLLVRPNPAFAPVEIQFTVDKSSEVDLRIYDVRGGVVKTVVSGFHRPDTYRSVWNGLDERNRQVPAGIYFCQLVVDAKKQTTKMLVIK